MDTITMYKTLHGWRWTRRDANNQLIIGASSQEYSRQEDARHNIESTQRQPYELIVNGEPSAEDIVEPNLNDVPPVPGTDSQVPVEEAPEPHDNRDGEKQPRPGKPAEVDVTEQVLKIARSEAKWRP